MFKLIIRVWIHIGVEKMKEMAIVKCLSIKNIKYIEGYSYIQISKLSVDYGVPQWTVLGPTLFLFSKLFLKWTSSNFYDFGDDTNYVPTEPNIQFNWFILDLYCSKTTLWFGISLVWYVWKYLQSVDWKSI